MGNENSRALGYCSTGCALEYDLEMFDKDKPRCSCGDLADAEDASIHCSFSCAFNEAPAIVKSMLLKKRGSTLPSTDRSTYLWKRIDFNLALATATVGIAEAIEPNLRQASQNEHVDSMCMVIASDISSKLAEKYGLLDDPYSDGKEKFLKHSRSLLSNLKKGFALEVVRSVFENNDEGASKLVQMDVKELAGSFRK